MQSAFFEEIANNIRSIAYFDIDKIYKSNNPGNLANIYSCSLTNPTPEDCSQLFYSMAPMIDADKYLLDLKDEFRTDVLNYWSRKATTTSISSLTLEDKIELYSTVHPITPDQKITITGESILNLLNLIPAQNWKNGILQRCIDFLVSPQYRGNSKVYAIIDQNYRRIMRFKCETEMLPMDKPILVKIINKITAILGLKHSHDTAIFNNIPYTVNKYCESFSQHTVNKITSASLMDYVSKILTIWSGSKIIQVTGGYQLQVEPDILEGVSYMNNYLPKPRQITLLESPL